MSIHQLPDGRWFVKIPDKDKQSGSRREYFGRGISAETKARARDREIDLKRTRPKKEVDTSPTLHELAVAYLESRNLPAESFRKISVKLKNIILPVLGNIQTSGLTFDHIDKYVNDRLKTVSRATVANDLTIIHAILNWAKNRKPPLIPFNPISGHRKPTPEPVTIYPPTVHELQEIIKHSSMRLKRLIIISYFTGLRPGPVEATSLKWDAVNLDAGLIRITSAAKGGIQIRDVPIHPDFKKELEEWKATDNGNSEYLIPPWHGGKPVTMVNETWARAKKKAGITRRLRLYDIRHLFVTNAIESGVDYKTLSDIVGSDPETLRRHYQHVSSEMKKNAIDKVKSLW